jgi:hypothetical protein
MIFMINDDNAKVGMGNSDFGMGSGHNSLSQEAFLFFNNLPKVQFELCGRHKSRCHWFLTIEGGKGA